MKSIKISNLLIIFLGLYSSIFLFILNVSIHATGSKTDIAIINMATGLVFLWVVVCGSLMYVFKYKIRKKIQKIRIGEKNKFVLLATSLALIEEVIAVFMTNLAPVFGVGIGEAFITASANYFQVIFFHSVIVFIPMFIVWSFLLDKYQFSAAQVFLLFGLTGSLSEMIINPISLIGGFWFFVYGLMIFLPSYSFKYKNQIKPVFSNYVLAVILPLIAAAPWAIIVYYIRNYLGVSLFVS